MCVTCIYFWNFPPCGRDFLQRGGMLHHARKHGTMSACDNNSVRGRKCPQRGRKFEDVVENSVAKTTVRYVDIMYNGKICRYHVQR